ncbi:MAG: hypothetical protein JWM57_41 [Phycisphaerales bacterium]|nr:hypothetical protein [Phycisphaerales bacterium]
MLWRVCWIACLTALALAGIDWGLPSADATATLFASHSPWDGKALAAFDAERVDPGKGADVDRDPLPKSAGPTILNATDADRAAIARRYKLFSHQPDEMITFMALQQMSPADRQFDPRLYQYGGAWIYPVGGLLKLAATAGLIDLRADKAFYYDNPAAFGRFYVVARLYTVAAFVATMVLAGMIVKRLGGDDFAAGAGSAVVGALPVVFALAHEAKPHLAGTALILATALAGARWVRTDRWRDALWCGALAGLAAGMVLSAVVALIIPLTMVVLPRPKFATIFNDSPNRRVVMFGAALAAFICAFAVTNPYVVLHAIHRDDVLTSNLGNTQAMYGVGQVGDILRHGSRRLLDALSWPAVLLAVGALVVAITRRQRTSPLGILLTVPAALVLLQFVLLSANKPAEYARFALLPATALGIMGVWALATMQLSWLRTTALVATPLAILVVGTWPYVNAFTADSTAGGTRAMAGTFLRQTGAGTLQMFAEPAPYAVPPADLWSWRFVLTPSSSPPIGDAVIRAIDTVNDLGPVPIGYQRQVIGDDRPAPITWANKPFEILTRMTPAE